MSFKLFDTVSVEEALVTLENVSMEDMIEGTLIANEAYNEFLAVLSSINSAKEACSVLNTNIEISKEALANDTVTVNDVKFLNSSINATMFSVGMESNPLSVSNEDIKDPKEQLTASIEEGNGLFMKIVNTVNKTFARFENILFKYLGKFDTMLLSIGANLEKTKNKIKEAEAVGKVITTKEISDSSIFFNKTWLILGAMGISENKDLVKAIKEMESIYKDPGYIGKFVDMIVSMGKSSGPLKPIYNNKEIFARLKKNILNKISNFFCKSGEDDKVIIGANYGAVYILERCKLFHIESKLNSYQYSINFTTYDSMDAMGNMTSFKAPTYKEIYEIIDIGINVVNSHKKYTDEIHGILKINGEHINKLDESSDWEHGNIYGIIPSVLFILAKTYADIPVAVDGVSKIFLGELKVNK